jgi:HEPN domain-containing protein
MAIDKQVKTMSEDLQRQLNRVATHFRKQADYDYISARANCRMGLRQQFLWAGLQAVEKYLKAILLFNGKSAKKGGHDLEKLCKKVKEIDYLKKFLVEECNQRFLSYLSKQGDNRIKLI